MHNSLKHTNSFTHTHTHTLSSHGALVFDAVNKEVAGRKLLPQHKSGTPEQHLSRGEDPSTGVVEGERVVDNVVWCEGAKQVDTMGHHIEPSTG